MVKFTISAISLDFMDRLELRNGAQGMSQSQAYPIQFGFTVARLHMEYVSGLQVLARKDNIRISGPGLAVLPVEVRDCIEQY